MKEKKINKYVAVIFAGIALLIVAAAYFTFHPGDRLLEGQVEVTQVKVASKLAGRIDDIFVSEGARVKKGEPLIVLSSPELSAKYEQALAAQKAAIAQRHKAYRGARDEEIRAARENYLRADAAAGLADKTFERVERLYKDGVLPEQKYDEAKGQRDAARRGADAAKAAYDMASAGARLEDKESAQALLDQASGMVAEVRAYLAETRLAAPLDGEVVEILSERGELVSPGYPIISIADMNDLWITFNIREDYLAGLKIGDVVEVTIPALEERVVRIKINYISALGDYATWRSTKATGDFDLRTFEVRGVPEKKDDLRPGMTAIINWSDAVSMIKAERTKK